MDKVGVDGAIFISAFSLYQYDASYAVEVQRKHPGRFAIIKPVNPADPAVGEVIAEWKKQPGAVAVRIMMTTAEAGLRPDDPGLDRIAREAARHGFPVNVLFWGNLEAGTTLIDRHPNTRFIIDHMAIQQPRTPRPARALGRPAEGARAREAPERADQGERRLHALARSPIRFPTSGIRSARLIDAWGIERCLWGTDWTRAFAVVNYEQAVEPFLRTDRLSESERAMLMGGACAKAYGWSLKDLEKLKLTIENSSMVT